MIIMNMNIQSLMREAQKMQKDLQKTQSELSNTDYTGTSSLVSVVLNGNKDLKSVKINLDDDLSKDDIEMLEDMLIVAFSDASKKAIIFYLAVILAALIISIVASPILYFRYLLIITGLLIFYISDTLSNANKYVLTILLILIFVMSCSTMDASIAESYDSRNNEAITYLKENIKDDDIVIYSRISMSALTERMREKNINAYYVSTEYWTFEAYKAFDPYMHIVEDLSVLDDYHGNIWVLEENSSDLKNRIKEQYKVVDEDTSNFYQPYKDISFTVHKLVK